MPTIKLCHFLALQKVTKKSVLPEGDFCARGRRKTTVKAEANAQIPRFLSFAAITDRNHIFSNNYTLL